MPPRPQRHRGPHADQCGRRGTRHPYPARPRRPSHRRVMPISAPGKLFLIGEYAVLDGAAAVLSAVDRRVQVRTTTANDGYWHIHAPDIGINALRLNADGTLPTGLGAGQHRRLRLYA